MHSDYRGRIIRKVFVFTSVFVVCMLVAYGLSKFTHEEISNKNTDILGVSTASTITEIMPKQPKASSIFKPKQVEITYRGYTYKGLTYANTVADAVRDFDIELTDITQLHPDGDTKLGNFTYIKVDEVVTKIQTEYAYIQFSTEEIEDPNVEWGIRNTIKPGALGQKKMTYEYIYVNDKLVDKKLVNEELITSAINEVVSVGTKKVYKTIMIEGKEITYWRIIEGMRATSYDRSCPGCSDYTYTGKLLVKGMVAVDPSVIPLGTHLYVPGYGDACAEDIGGAVKGNRIDLGFDKISNWYGKVSYGPYVDVYVLD